MNDPLELYCVVRRGLVATQGGVWKLPADAWREYLMILMWETRHGATLFAEMNGGDVKLVSETFDPSVILRPSETRSPHHDDRCSVESPGIDPRAVGQDDCPGNGPNRHPVQPQVGPTLRPQEPAIWLVVVWLVVVVLMAATAKYGVLP